MPGRTASLRRIWPDRVPAFLPSPTLILAPPQRLPSLATAARLVLVVTVSVPLVKEARGFLGRVSFSLLFARSLLYMYLTLPP